MNGGELARGRPRPSAQAGNAKEMTLAWCMGSKIPLWRTAAHSVGGCALKVQKVPHGDAWQVMTLLRRSHMPVLAVLFRSCDAPCDRCCDHLIRAAQLAQQARSVTGGSSRSDIRLLDIANIITGSRDTGSCANILQREIQILGKMLTGGNCP